MPTENMTACVLADNEAPNAENVEAELLKNMVLKMDPQKRERLLTMILYI